jgi:hypothetical protein
MTEEEIKHPRGKWRFRVLRDNDPLSLSSSASIRPVPVPGSNTGTVDGCSGGDQPAPVAGAGSIPADAARAKRTTVR